MAARAKYAASVAALSVTSRAMHVVGGRGALRKRGLERLVRDVRTATLMPPNEDRCLEIIASAELGTSPIGVLDAPTK
jgi:alkylation response protein AidB-like acyl-CoA dehydrogenase